MKVDLQLPSHDIIEVELEYEQLDKHCFFCKALSLMKIVCVHTVLSHDLNQMINVSWEFPNRILWKELRRGVDVKMRGNITMVPAGLIPDLHPSVLIRHCIMTTPLGDCQRGALELMRIEDYMMIRAWLTELSLPGGLRLIPIGMFKIKAHSGIECNPLMKVTIVSRPYQRKRTKLRLLRPPQDQTTPL
ncbi:unnamed protein product [Brassica oleracea]